ncbi:monocarboxylate transporter 12-like [Mytilus edulis]|uniref:monocarboxylate transporter 12-like n=1 Tax=Mytilus edulis TaxID=6550 RepID=UPI0039EF5D89
MTVVKQTEYQRPVDRGWAWVVMCAIFLQLFLNVGISKSFGLFFIQFIIVYKTSASLISGVIALQTAMFSLSSLFILSYGTKLLGPRKLVMIGSILVPAGYLLNAFAPDVAFLILSQSVLFGTGCALTLGPGLVVLSSYFDKRRGFANTISNIGASIGSLVFPKIIQVLIDMYGLQGALIFVSGILFHNLIVAMLLRPLPPLVETSGSIEGNNEKEELLKYTKKEVEFSESANPKTENRDKKSNSDAKDVCSQPNQNISSSLQEKNSQILNDKINDTLKQLKETSGISYNEKKLIVTNELCRSSLDLYTSTGSISCSIHNLRINEKVGVSSCSQSKATCCTKTSLTSLIDFKLLKNHKLQLVLFVAYFCIFSCGLTITYIPPFARENNTSDEEIAIIVMLFGACDVVARFSIAWISDSKKIKRTNILGITLLITGTVTMFNSFFTNFTSFAMFCVVNGLFGSIYFPFVPLLLVDSVGADNLPSALSLLILVHGISISIMAPLMGYIRDSTGSYNVTFYVIGCGMIIGALALFCDSWVMKLEEQRLQKNREVDSEVEEQKFQKNDIGHEEVVAVNGESTN